MNVPPEVPAERGSVRPVTLDSEPGKTFYCEVRANPKIGLGVGAIVWVNFGTQNKVDGQWRQCLVLPSPEGTNTASGVHVRLSPAPAKAPPHVPFG